ncbi:MAG: UDP-2,4-diacetamido-2,4,6-trideoxy-beta-L-altropyranose hydrolase [Pseudomonadota bacterium]
MQRVAIRADASTSIGTGHIFRSIAIFEGWRNQGGECLFVCQDVPGNMIGYLSWVGFDVLAIRQTADQRDDAAAFCDAVQQWGGADAVWVDHYGLDATWENELQSAVQVVGAMDDLANRSHACDLLVDSSHGTDERHLYDGLLQKQDSLCLIGPAYVALRKEFAEYKQEMPFHPSRAKNVVVTLGGNDPLDASNLVLNAIDCSELSDIAFRLTVGSANSRAEELLARAETLQNVTALYQHEDMVGLMAWGDLCIGAGGTTSWERCYMGLATLGLTLAENQSAFMTRLEQLGVARSVGWADRISVSDLRAEIVDAVCDRAWRMKASTIGLELIDGQGAKRIIDAIVAMVHRRVA